MYRSLAETIAYVSPDGEIFCPEHGSEDEEGWASISLSGSETDSPSHCSWFERDSEGHLTDCGRLIRSDLTPDGQRYVLEQIGKYLAGGRGSRGVLTEWWAEWGSDIVFNVKEYELETYDLPWFGEAARHYLVTALWSSTGEDSEPLGRTYTPSNIAPASQDRMSGDLVAFACANLSDLAGMEPGQAAHDFWLTRNHHGAGFWDRGLGELGDRLTASAESYGESDLYVGDDGELYVS